MELDGDSGSGSIGGIDSPVDADEWECQDRGFPLLIIEEEQ